MVQHLPGMSEALNSYTWGSHFTNEDHGLARGCEPTGARITVKWRQPPILRVKKLEFLGG